MSTVNQISVKVQPMAWAKYYLDLIPEVNSHVEFIADVHKQGVGGVAKYSKLTFSGWMALAAMYFIPDDGPILDESKINWMESYRFISAINWSYERICYVIKAELTSENLLNRSVLQLPSKTLLGFAENNRYATYISLAAVLEIDDKRVGFEGGEGFIEGLMLMVIDADGENGDVRPILHMVIVGGERLNVIPIPIGDWDIKTAITTACDNLLAELLCDAVAGDTEESLDYLTRLINLSLFVISDDAVYVSINNENSEIVDDIPGPLPDLRLVTTVSKHGMSGRKWMATKNTDGTYSTKLMVVN